MTFCRRFAALACAALLLLAPRYARARPSLVVTANESFHSRHGVVLRNWSPSWVVGLSGWWSADQGVTIATGVSAWADRSPTGNTATQSTGSKQPTQNTSDSAAGGMATLSFASASSQDLVLASVIPSAPFTVFAVGQSVSGATVQPILGTAANIPLYFNGTNWAMYAGVSGVISSNSTRAMSAFIAVMNGSSSALYINSSTTAAAIGNAGTNAPSSPTVIGFQPGTSNYLNGKVEEVGVISNAADVYTRGRLMTYFGNRCAGAWQ